MIHARIAPTPSGFLHVGNGMNFILTWLLTRKEDGVLRLRIDDLDAPRINSDYIEDVFRTLEWLGIDWDEGPQTPDEQYKVFSQQLRIERYNELINELKERGHLFTCTCSRKEVQGHSTDGQYPGTCRSKGWPLDMKNTSLRISISSPCIVHINDMLASEVKIDLYSIMRDPVIQRRDRIPAYHMASLADDIDYGIDLIVRGEDLVHSTAAQLYIAGLLDARQFPDARFYHHPLIKDEQGFKLSKSAGSNSLRSWRNRGVRAGEFYLMLSRILKADEEAVSAHELLQLFREGKLIFPSMRSVQ